MNGPERSQGRGGGPPAHAGGPHNSKKGGFPPGLAKNMDKLPDSNPWKQKFMAEEAEAAEQLEAEKAVKEAEEKEAVKLEAEATELAMETEALEAEKKVAEDAKTTLTKAAITGDTTVALQDPNAFIQTVAQTTTQVPITQAVATLAGPTLIQDTTFFGQSIDPNSTAGKIAFAASTTPITITGDPTADRINAFIRNTNILLGSTGSQAVGGGA